MVLSTHMVSATGGLDTYEWVLDEYLQVVGCSKIPASVPENRFLVIMQDKTTLHNQLFELDNIVLDNHPNAQHALNTLRQKLLAQGIPLGSAPHPNEMASLFRPLGKSSAIIRFYCNPEGQLIFVSPNATKRLSLIRNTPC
ncbi:MAG: hypothetical protein V4490_08175 [Pseudomonadota bacterium]